MKSIPIHNQPQFLGAIQQRYRPRNDRPAKSFQQWIDRIRQAINEKLLPSLQKIGCVVDRAKVTEVLANSSLQPYDLAHIPDFNSLIAISQQLEKPVFALSDDDIREKGKVFGHAESTMLASRDSFADVFSQLGRRVLVLTS